MNPDALNPDALNPSIEFSLLMPMILVFAGGIAGVVVEAFAPRRARYAVQVALSVVVLVVALVWVASLAGTRSVAILGSVAIDGVSLVLQGAVLVVTLASVALVAERTRARVVTNAAVHAGHQSDHFAAQAATVPGSVAERDAERAGVQQTEVFPLVLFAAGGMMLMPAANDLLTMFVALELLSLPLYLMCALARHRRLLSQEAALKYFLLGAFASAIFLFGVAMLYGAAGTLDLAGIAASLAADDPGREFAVVGGALVVVGLLFKVGAVPFHSWVPDVYQGAPTPITAFMAAATKIAAFGALLRLLHVALPSLVDSWRPVVWVVSILSMVFGSILAMTQTDIKRMLAYSSVAHAGFLLTALVSLDGTGISSVLFYLIAYAVTTLAAFAVVTLVREPNGAEATTLAQWAGLGRRSPVVAGAFAVALLALAGIPLTSGFIGKFAVFQAAAGAGGGALVVVGVLASAIAAYFYVRVIGAMYFTDPDPDIEVLVVRRPATAGVVAAATVATVLLGVFPQPLLDLVNHAASFV
ncbi:NADH-quinone oxidoreductase subunit NuoN [Rhodococcus rhodnii]|uniref:NADH-quinone oxidoreductase subunit N n=2 Tax=Rhodococcus rhodnii TaxID=38312 RepID=R7WKA4_9NOCA|nr:NADH-quinone oxidoreductase subunit NuoN [Rhodococcus rhodnii]EOM75715.1 NADH dehydrogenase subunit N [Rhodococcus rhodnii LMG 5362]TXG89645.1 NADH-quinone oxidoreductase subunit NuoN [Rhodococcus rhodnii]